MQGYFCQPNTLDHQKLSGLDPWGLLPFAHNFPIDTQVYRVYFRNVAQQTLEFLSTRISKDMMAQINKLAEQERRSLSLMTRLLLEEALKLRGNGRKR